MKYAVEINNTKGAFTILLFDEQNVAIRFCANINYRAKETGLTAIYYGAF